MTRGGPQGSTFTIAQFIYETAFTSFNMGLASAAGVILMLITLAFTVVQPARDESDIAARRQREG